MTVLRRLDRQLATGADLQGRADVAVPEPANLLLPERAVQFGTGALLRGLVDAILDDANRAGSFGGRVVAVGSTGSGRDQLINQQDGLFTLVAQGLESGSPIIDRRVIGALSRAVSAVEEWDAVLRCARDPLIEVIFSNTTEVGIALDERDAAGGDLAVPRSFPAKLTRFLDERARTFAFARDKGVVVIPCELIERNGDALRQLVLVLAQRWKLDERFVEWLHESVRFCNTLVDRIVTGVPARQDGDRLTRELGYQDDLLTICEPYRLLVIEGDDGLRARLRFARAEFGAVVVDDVRPYRERKVRLLNGAHTIVVSLALLAGCETVLEALTHEHVGKFLNRVVFDEIVPTVEVASAASFARQVLERFANPFVNHQLRDITLHGGMKMRVRIVPSIVAYAKRNGRPPASLALGFAAYLLFARGDLQRDLAERGMAVPPDAVGEGIRDRWRLAKGAMPEGASLSFVRSVCADTALWDADLDAVSGFSELVTGYLLQLQREGVLATLKAHLVPVNEAQHTHALT